MLTVLYHADADGFGAAYAVWKNLEAEARDAAAFIAVQYNEPVPEIDERTTTLMVVDFSYSREVCDALNEKYALVVIDHHESAEEALAGAEYAFFDGSKSGAVLTWEYMTDAPVPELLAYVQDYDRWQFELPNSREFNAYIQSLPWCFREWDAFECNDQVLFAGSAAWRLICKHVKKMVKAARVIRPVAVDTVFVEVNCRAYINEVCEALLEEYPEADVARVYFDVSSRKKRVLSLRSREGGVNVAKIAEGEGGGGHRNAAGYSYDFMCASWW